MSDFQLVKVVCFCGKEQAELLENFVSRMQAEWDLFSEKTGFKMSDLTDKELARKVEETNTLENFKKHVEENGGIGFVVCDDCRKKLEIISYDEVRLGLNPLSKEDLLEVMKWKTKEELLKEKCLAKVDA